MFVAQALGIARASGSSGVRRLRQDRVAVGAAVVIGALVLLAIFGPYLSPYSYDALD